VTVIEALPNGNLVVSGGETIGINQGIEFIRLSGVVNPIHIMGTQFLQFKSRMHALNIELMDILMKHKTMGWLSRFFLTVSPSKWLDI